MRFSGLRVDFKNIAGSFRLPLFRNLSRYEQEYLARIFAGQERGSLKAELKLRVYEVLRKLMAEHRKPFGFLLVLGWNQKWNEQFMSLPDASQNIFEQSKSLFLKQSVAEETAKLSRTIDFDGAVLVSPRGRALASGVYLENMKPKHVIERMGITRYEDLSQAFGFSRKVHTRHLAGIAASYWLKNTLVYVVSEEDRTLRVFENGRIIYSPYKKEIAWNR